MKSEWHDKPQRRPQAPRYGDAPRRPRTDLLFGIRAVMEAVEAGKEIERVLVKRGLDGPLAQEMLTLLRRHEIPVQAVPIEKINAVSRKNHQGVLAFAAPITYSKLENLLPALYEEGKEPLLMLLCGVTDVRNVGAVARTVECVGADALIVPERGGAQLNADTVKTSAGALNHIAVCRCRDMKETIRFLKDSGLKIVAVTEHGSVSYVHADLTGPVALLMGAEDAGIPADYLPLCDAAVKIPLFGAVESLNVSVAASILLYEVKRQRNLL